MHDEPKRKPLAAVTAEIKSHDPAYVLALADHLIALHFETVRPVRRAIETALMTTLDMVDLAWRAYELFAGAKPRSALGEPDSQTLEGALSRYAKAGAGNSSGVLKREIERAFRIAAGFEISLREEAEFWKQFSEIRSSLEGFAERRDDAYLALRAQFDADDRNLRVLQKSCEVYLETDRQFERAMAALARMTDQLRGENAQVQAPNPPNSQDFAQKKPPAVPPRCGP